MFSVTLSPKTLLIGPTTNGNVAADPVGDAAAVMPPASAVDVMTEVPAAQAQVCVGVVPAAVVAVGGSALPVTALSAWLLPTVKKPVNQHPSKKHRREKRE